MRWGQQLGYIPTLRGIEEEGLAAGRVKHETKVLVIMGNPPYERTSHNSNPHSNRLIEDFYMLDGGRLRDRNSAPLKDDYLRFLRWAVWKLLEQEDSPKHGIIAFVTNRAFIERKLHRGVRRFLMSRFDEIHIFDLHGDQREWYADRVDEKVFKDVQAGIVLTVFVKRPGESTGPKLVRYRERYGTRAEKFLACKEASLDDDGWQVLEPRAPLWMFVNYQVPPEYDTWPSVAQLLPESSSGVQTHRDPLVVAFTEAELRERLARFADARVANSSWEEQDIKSNRDWKLTETRASIRATPPRNVMRWTYRPFDRRWIAFDERLIDFTRTAISPHLLERPDNLCLAFATGSLQDGPYAFPGPRSPRPSSPGGPSVPPTSGLSSSGTP
jgi:predicted helicase